MSAVSVNCLRPRSKDIFAVITVLAPNGGELLFEKSPTTITWQNTGPPIAEVKLEYSPDNGQNYITIDPNTPNDGTFDWDPLPDIDSTEVLVRVSDTINPATNDFSDGAFTIFQCLTSLTADLTGDCFVNFDDFVQLRVYGELLQGGVWAFIGSSLD